MSCPCFPVYVAVRGPAQVDPADRPQLVESSVVVCMVVRRGPAHHEEIRMQSSMVVLLASKGPNVGASPTVAAIAQIPCGNKLTHPNERWQIRHRQKAPWVFVQWHYFFGRWRFRSRTPGPPPFSSMNSTPATSKARLIASSLATVRDVHSLLPRTPDCIHTDSGFPRQIAALHRSSARAPLI